ncbi:putative manganese-dependent inorganic pyrophosphatase [Companilactobacillus sp. RD055328]|uniref:manganese-dependent inorganic pyrophosphatase n=1 Tax=Companilactobacillus sp. RD055328 TaxID=2916634 RepID=UPI001FC85D2F|nr:manganese-dependent inorganic pyrophosphatase [Companilactobacillus sp. RD055328]GKQ42709.1 putative manganese-dependent inorganic pyrophosphatase [Companilactobacillus sp. RD055328]
MTKELIFGHKNPDTDAIIAAIAYSYMMNESGKDTEAVALGEPNEETKFVFNHFNYDYPRIISSADTKQVMLVDHNEPKQSVDNISDVEITNVIDHHRIANFETANPLFYHAEPLGSTSTIIWKLMNQARIEIPATLAGLMMSAIISDTLLLKSPTTTNEDEAALKSLSKTAGLDYESYGLEMLKAGTNLASKSAKELIEMDAKTFDMNNKSIRIDQINTVDLDETLQRKAEFEEAIKAEMSAENENLFILLITNILTSDTKAIVLGDDESVSVFEKTFDQKLVDNIALLPGVVSRKKQVVPQLNANF